MLNLNQSAVEGEISYEPGTDFQYFQPIPGTTIVLYPPNLESEECAYGGEIPCNYHPMKSSIMCFRHVLQDRELRHLYKQCIYKKKGTDERCSYVVEKKSGYDFCKLHRSVEKKRKRLEEGLGEPVRKRKRLQPLLTESTDDEMMDEDVLIEKFPDLLQKAFYDRNLELNNKERLELKKMIIEELIPLYHKQSIKIFKEFQCNLDSLLMEREKYLKERLQSLNSSKTLDLFVYPLKNDVASIYRPGEFTEFAKRLADNFFRKKYHLNLKRKPYAPTVRIEKVKSHDNNAVALEGQPKCLECSNKCMLCSSYCVKHIGLDSTQFLYTYDHERQRSVIRDVDSPNSGQNQFMGLYVSRKSEVTKTRKLLLPPPCQEFEANMNRLMAKLSRSKGKKYFL